jgi:hypothetical protein
VSELVDEVKELIGRVEEQIAQPAVQALGLEHRVGIGAVVENPVPTDVAVVLRGGGAKSSSAAGPDDS